MTRFRFLPEILAQHVAVLGKTGSGKTSTAKLAIEQVVAEGARVCVLDPIKSDWWGLTSSADGRHAGLPFHILGGPHGHVPLHASAGKAIAEIVASGALPLSIVDMADFEPGGQAKFFVDFVPALLRKMRGVVYLVLEEAHLFAPKERSGVGEENLSIHWAKTMATAGRSKGIRLVLVTQRTQALHNALLGSCDTLIAHRLTAPADQKPVLDWLKANTDKDVLEQVAGSLASLKTGEGWICAGEAKQFERVHFPRITTYDNTATPTGDATAREVKTAPVDQDKLRAIIGEAVEQAKADDPRELRRQIAELKSQVVKAASQPKPTGAPERQPKPVLTDADRALLEKWAGTLAAAVEKIKATTTAQRDALVKDIEQAVGFYLLNIEDAGQRALAHVEKILDGNNFQKILEKLAAVTPAERPQIATPRLPVQARTLPNRPQVPSSRPARPVSDGAAVDLKPMHRAMLIALAQHPEGLSKKKIRVHTGYADSGPVSSAFATLIAEGWATGDRAQLRITDLGLAALGSYEPLPLGDDLRAWLLAGDKLNTMEKALLREACAVYPDDIAKGEARQRAGYADSGPVSSAFAKLVGLDYLVSVGKGRVRAAEELFS